MRYCIIDKINEKNYKGCRDAHMNLENDIEKKFQDYSIDDYSNDIKSLGIKKTWDSIIEYVLQGGNKNNFLSVVNFGQIYEIGLAISDKQQKKESGQYYTPDDISQIMSQWLSTLDAENICDVGCGTGQLILKYFQHIGRDKTINLLDEGKLYLYDIDEVALKICKTSILLRYGKQYSDKIHCIVGDFLDEKIVLPQNCKVIANPPYASIKSIPTNWENTEIQFNTMELYSAFMEKILKQSKYSVIISPYSFISGNKFYLLRKLMNNYNGFIISFDNVPGNIFLGRKHGIFNTNTTNSVRAAITVVENKKDVYGFRLSPLIRFKNIERNKLLNCDVLENFIYDKYQLVDRHNTKFYKCDKRLGKIFEAWIQESNKTLADYISKSGSYCISMPSTCRYYTTASDHPLNRRGQLTIYFYDKDVFNFVFCMVNSSFAYWYWRLYDGGITYPKNLLMELPMFFDRLSESDKIFFEDITNQMIIKSSCYKIEKNNVGIQENIKYPREYRDKINARLMSILKINESADIFDIVHSNTAMEVNI